MKADCIPIPFTPGKRWRLFRSARHYDAVVIQKKTSFKSVELALLRHFNPHLIFDFDDAVMFHELEHDRPLNGKYFRKFLTTINHCRAVVAGNGFLAGFARPNCSQVWLLPTPIDMAGYRLKDYAAPTVDRVAVGWLGVPGGLKYLEMLGPVFANLSRRFPQFVLEVISTRPPELPGIPVSFVRWSAAREVDQLCALDIGIMPLPETLWTQGKCGYKLLQYMAVGLPVVASPVGINADLVHPGENGFLARTPEEWESQLAGLMESATRRRALGEQGYRLVQEHYSLSRYSRRYAEILRQVAGIGTGE